MALYPPDSRSCRGYERGSVRACEHTYVDVHQTQIAELVLNTNISSIKWLVGADPPAFTFPRRTRSRVR